MNTSFTLRRAALLLPLTLPSLCWAANALIVNDGTAGLETTVTTNLSGKLVAAGYVVTTSVGVPGGSLATYSQIWDIRFNNTTPLTGGDITAYITYMSGGGSLFVMGENTGFITRDNSIVALVAAAGGGTITITTPNNTQTVQPPFTGPNAVTTVTFLAAAGSPGPPGNGTFITNGVGNIGAGLVFPPGTLANAPAGALLIVFDVNFLDIGAAAPLQALSDNMIAYLAAPTFIATGAPAPSSVLLVLIGVGAIVAFEMRRRRKRLVA